MDERAYTIPLRPVYNRAKRAVRAKRAMKHIREFIAHHMKVGEENVKIHVSVNHIVWQKGIQKPPRKIKVVAVKNGEIVWVYTPEERAKLIKAAAKKRRAARRRKKKVSEETAEKEKKAEPSKEDKTGKKKTATDKKPKAPARNRKKRKKVENNQAKAKSEEQ